MSSGCSWVQVVCLEPTALQHTASQARAIDLQQNLRFRIAMGCHVGLCLLAAATLSGKLRVVTLIVLASFGVRTWLAKLRLDREQEED
ncbi:MAG: hypothetical protein NZV14_10280 [Bryobacteraceae bacterium]|nr:hypothetical protein [Bryobacteraceae bacterium]MDW8378539.1 hypothetical protein [Bryobacterales bacterium]